MLTQYSTTFILLIAVSIATFLICLAITRNAKYLKLVATTNDRSSHLRPTPTGGGAGFVFITTLTSLIFIDLSSNALIFSAITCGIAILGLIDDQRSLSARLRLCVQTFFVAWTLYMFFPLNVLDTFASDFLLLSVFTILLGVAGLWWINLFNFMDGIDGFAATQAIFMLFAALILSLHQLEHIDAMIGVAVVLTASLFGFLALNWPPAKIFMGDVGSLYLALFLFGFALHTINMELVTVQSWIILSSLFTCDATVTLLRRLKNGHNPIQAHRSHLYQRLSRRFGSHKMVTIGWNITNYSIVLPLAWYANQHSAMAVSTSIMIACCVVFILVISFLGAGKADKPLKKASVV
jgi:Fuc2NAc and GlcNAc transferase